MNFDEIKDKLAKLENYKRELRQLSRPTKTVSAIMADANALFAQSQFQEAQEQEKNRYVVVQFIVHFVFLPILRCIQRICLDRTIRGPQDLSLFSWCEGEYANNVYNALALCDSKTRREIFTQLGPADSLRYHFDNGIDDFCNYIETNSISLEGIRNWAWCVCLLKDSMTMLEVPLNPDATCETKERFELYTKEVIREATSGRTKNEFSARFLMHIHNLEKDNCKNIGHITQDQAEEIVILLQMVLYIFWNSERQVEFIDGYESGLIEGIIRRTRRVVLIGDKTLSDWYSNAHEKFIETAEKYPQSLILPPDEIKIEQHSSIIETTEVPIDYEEPADMPGINKVIGSLLEKAIPSQYAEKISMEDVYEWIGDPNRYEFSDKSIFEQCKPKPEDKDKYIGLKENITRNGLLFCIFVNSLANIGYLVNTEENLQRFVFRLTGCTLKDYEEMKKSEAVKLLSSPYGKGTNQTSKALWFIIQSICDTGNNGGSRQTIESKGSVYEKSTRLFAYSLDKDEQRWFTDKNNYKQTSNHQRADDRIKVLLYLLFDVPIKKSDKQTSRS